MKNLSKKEMQDIRGGFLTCSYGEITQCVICHLDLAILEVHCMACPGWGVDCGIT